MDPFRIIGEDSDPAAFLTPTELQKRLLMNRNHLGEGLICRFVNFHQMQNVIVGLLVLTR